MDGSYGNVFPTSKAMAPSAPAPAPSGNQYKVNVNRQKTKKWANFKPQNYDGDDWGDDYDEPAHEPNPPPPPKPMGPRQPAAYSPTTDTARPFHPVGSPPLRTQTQQYAAPVPASARPGQTPSLPGTPSMHSAPARRATEPYRPSPHNTQGHSQPPFPPDATRATSSPRSPHQLPSQLPPQKSGIDPNDAAERLESTWQSGSNPQPSDNSKPWMEARSASPQNAGPAVSPTKPLPLIRPADVYQRMEQERAKTRQPLEIGHSSADNAGFRHRGSAAPEMQTERDRQAGSVGSPTREDPHTGRTAQPITGLASVPERQSEYGIEGFLASYGGEGPGAEVPTSHEHMESAEPQKSVPPLSLENIRRFSTSPQLPDLTRMSGFGEDLFSSSFFPASGLRSPVSGSMQLSMSGEDMPDSNKSAAAGDAPGQSAQSMVSNIAKDADSTSREEASQSVSGVGRGADASGLPPNEPDRDQSAGLSSHQAAAQPMHNVAEQQTPAEDAAREPASRNDEQPATLTARPHLPGGWVSETPSTLGPEVSASPVAGPARETPDKASESEGRLDTDAQAGIAPLKATGSQPSEPETGVAEGSGGVENNPISAPLDPDTPHPLSPPGRSSPTPSTKLDMSSEQAPPEVADRKASPSPEIRVVGQNSPTRATATTEQSEITPTAPLNPRRGTPDGSTIAPPVLSPPPIVTEQTLDAEAHSPVKDSDKLSEEIIKSLSPTQPTSGGLSDNAEGSTAAYHAAAADPTRESSYLGDVYGDYWTATEDKADPGVLTLDRTADREDPGRAPSPVPVKNPEQDSNKPSDMVRSSSPGTISHESPPALLDPQSENAAGAEGLPKRFSWEPLPEESAPAAVPPPTTDSPPTAGLSRATDQLDEQKALGSGAENVAPPTEKLEAWAKAEPSQPSLGSEGRKSADDLRAESAPELNPGATLAPTPVPARPMPPSPVSDLTDRQSGAKRLSLAEEKIVLQDSASPFTPPPLEQHPVFAETRRPQRDEPPSAPSPKNILGFRNIMEMPLPSERIKHYNETRWQFSAVDTGLDEWLRMMMAKHPEHASAVWSIQGAAPQTQQSGQGATQTHHGVGQSLRSPAHLHMPHQLQQGLSGLGHSSNQVGTKSKELLMAAGKAGKGLFSKGRNKLRGTGDKVFSNS